MSSSEIAVSVSNLSKRYQIYDTPRDRLKQFIAPRLQTLAGQAPKQYFREFWALKDVSIEVKKGETVGIVGRNGSGKSTLLQIIARTLNPTTGNVVVDGRVTALLELGSGFNPEYSGFDNVFLSGAVLGMSREEIERKFDSIAAFADIGPFLDQPAKTYSSGMYMRLAFAVAASLEPEIMIVDEALAVGDAKFQAKCFRHFEEFQESGGTVLLVTHSTEQVVRNCSSAVLLEGGRVLQQGEPRSVVNRYLDLLFGRKKEVIAVPALADSPDISAGFEIESVLTGRIESRPNYNKDEYRWGSGAAQIIDCVIVSGGHADIIAIEAGDSIDVYIKTRFVRASQNAIFGLTIKTPDGVTVFGANSRDCEGNVPCRPISDGEELVVRFSIGMNIAAGEYLLSLGIAEESMETGEVIPLDRRYDSMYILVQGKPVHAGLARLPIGISFIENGAAA
jgi:lipopolysaccharide transport system ATP-binding protein